MMSFSGPFKLDLLVAACEHNRGIGQNGGFPWPRLPREMKHFARLTRETKRSDLKNAVLMGRKTWESIPETNRPLEGRLNVVFTTNKEFDPKSKEVIVADSIRSALEQLEPLRSELESLWLIGGEGLFSEVLSPSSELCGRIYLTVIKQEFPSDTFMPEIDPRRFKEMERDDRGVKTNAEQEEEGVKYVYKVYERMEGQ